MRGGGSGVVEAPPTRDSVPLNPRAIWLVLGAATSVQFGAALAATLFDQLGPGGTVWLRLLFAAVILLVLWRPSLTDRRGETRPGSRFCRLLRAYCPSLRAKS
jgi:inner membrane transporter RhtA